MFARPVRTQQWVSIILLLPIRVPSLIANNMIYDVQANGTAGDFPVRASSFGAVVGTVNVYHTVTMVGTMTGGSYPTFAFCICQFCNNP